MRSVESIERTYLRNQNKRKTPDNKCLIFYIYIWTFNIDIQSLYITTSYLNYIR